MPAIATNHSHRDADEGSRYDRWESAVSHECEQLNALAAALFENLDADHEKDVRDVIYDAALKSVDRLIYPPNRHARRAMANR